MRSPSTATTGSPWTATVRRIFNLDRLHQLTRDTSRGLVLTGGSAANGGAVFNRENLTITGSTIEENSATSNGGGIYNDASAICVISSSTIAGNSAQNAAAF